MSVLKFAASRFVGLLGIFLGDEILTSYIGIIVNHDPRITIKQPGFHGKYPADIFFLVAHVVLDTHLLLLISSSQVQFGGRASDAHSIVGQDGGEPMISFLHRSYPPN